MIPAFDLISRNGLKNIFPVHKKRRILDILIWIGKKILFAVSFALIGSVLGELGIGGLIVKLFGKGNFSKRIKDFIFSLNTIKLKDIFLPGILDFLKGKKVYRKFTELDRNEILKKFDKSYESKKTKIDKL